MKLRPSTTLLTRGKYNFAADLIHLFGLDQSGLDLLLLRFGGKRKTSIFEGSQLVIERCNLPSITKMSRGDFFFCGGDGGLNIGGLKGP